jgi:pimeloyl-ACP methyl ester carboxylesterase
MRGWEEFDVEAGEVRLHARRQAGDGRPAVLLHGLGAGGIVWQAFARRLAPSWRVLAPDLRGHGQSDKPPTGYSAFDYARDIDAMVRALGLGAVPVIGHSLGALVALALAARSPDLVTAAVLLDPPLDPAIVNQNIETVYRLRHAPPGELEAYLSSPLIAPVFRQAADAPFEAVLDAPRGAPWAWDLALSITVPVLLVQADPVHGGVLGNQPAQDFVARLPHGELLVIPGAAHTVHVSHAARVAEAVLAFLSKHTTS